MSVYICGIYIHTHTHTHTYIYVSGPTVVKGSLKAPFSITTTLRCRGGCYPFQWIVPLTLELSVKQGGIKYYFLSLWYHPTWDWTPSSQTINKHSNHYAYIYIYIYIYIYRQHFFINTNFVEHNRHFLSTYFLLDPFILPYCFYRIGRELMDVFSIIVYYYQRYNLLKDI